VFFEAIRCEFSSAALGTHAKSLWTSLFFDFLVELVATDIKGSVFTIVNIA
jgi:hypothetical protein